MKMCKGCGRDVTNDPSRDEDGVIRSRYFDEKTGLCDWCTSHPLETEELE